MEITVSVKNNFGTEQVYPVCERAQTFARIACTKTLTRDTLALVKKLGYSIKVEQPELTV